MKHRLKIGCGPDSARPAFASGRLVLLLVSTTALIWLSSCGSVPTSTTDPLPSSGKGGTSGSTASTGSSSGTTSSGTTSSGSSGVTQAAPGSLQSITHIIFMVQENRSFDNYFGRLNSYRASLGLPAGAVDDLSNPSTPLVPNPTYDHSTCPNSPAGTCTVYKMVSACVNDLSPSWNESHTDRNLDAPASSTATMKGFAFEAGAYATHNSLFDTAGQRAMGYYDQTQLNYYYFMAAQFGISDRWFSPLMAKSEPNHLFQFAATSQGWVDIPTTQLSAPTIFNLLQSAGVSWKIYYTDVQRHTGRPDTFAGYFSALNKYGANIVPISDYFTDLQNGTLPAVALIESGRETGSSEHPQDNVQVGAKQAQSVIDPLMKSTAWGRSIFILTWDEGGGLYDHVPPLASVNPDGIAVNISPDPFIKSTFNDNFTYTGFRVPVIVISPFSKKGYVSHTPADYTAILKLIETRFNLPNLTKRDAAQFDMTEFFDFANVPNATAPTPPAQLGNAPCYFNALP